MSKIIATVLVVSAAGFMASAPAQAKGCIKGAIVGGVAGHMAGHGKLGAAAGCAVGHHHANKKSIGRDRQVLRCFRRRAWLSLVGAKRPLLHSPMRCMATVRRCGARRCSKRYTPCHVPSIMAPSSTGIER